MNKITLIVSALILAIIVVVIVLKVDVDKDQPLTSKSEPIIKNSNDSDKQIKEATIAQKWEWQVEQSQEEKNKPQQTQNSDLPFTTKSVHDALYAVKIDENDNLVLDNDALISLDEALERIYNKLDNEATLALEDLIKESLPGKVGQQTSEIVSNYKDYLVAKEQFSILHENTGYNSSEQTIATVERDHSLYGELQSLRELHLGQEVTENLFREHDANAEFMFDSIKLSLNESLTPQEREQQRQAIENRLREVVPLEIENSIDVETKVEE